MLSSTDIRTVTYTILFIVIIVVVLATRQSKVKNHSSLFIFINQYLKIINNVKRNIKLLVLKALNYVINNKKNHQYLKSVIEHWY